MAAVNEKEVGPGLVTYLDPKILANRQGVLTNVIDVARIPNRHGPFLVLKYDLKRKGYLCVPLFTDQGEDGFRVQLENKHKRGSHPDWLAQASYWHSRQFWIVPKSCFQAASENEITFAGKRNRYVKNQLEAIVNSMDDRQEFRALLHLLQAPVSPQ